jgi:hypothetical protein
MGTAESIAGTLGYMLAVVAAIAFFLRAVGHALSDEGHVTTGDKVEAGVAAVMLLFFIIGGFVWFRVLLVGT